MNIYENSFHSVYLTSYLDQNINFDFLKSCLSQRFNSFSTVKIQEKSNRSSQELTFEVKLKSFCESQALLSEGGIWLEKVWFEAWPETCTEKSTKPQSRELLLDNVPQSLLLETIKMSLEAQIGQIEILTPISIENNSSNWKSLYCRFYLPEHREYALCKKIFWIGSFKIITKTYGRYKSIQNESARKISVPIHMAKSKSWLEPEELSWHQIRPIEEAYHCRNREIGSRYFFENKLAKKNLKWNFILDAPSSYSQKAKNYLKTITNNEIDKS